MIRPLRDSWSPASTRIDPWQLAPWLVVPVLWFLLPELPVPLERALAGIFGLVVVVLAARRPDRAFVWLVLFLPLQLPLLATLYRNGVPPPVLRGLSLSKEAVLAGLIVAAVRAIRRDRRILDGIDRAVVLFVAGVLVYALLGPILTPGSPADVGARISGMRQIVAFPLAAFALKHVDLGERSLQIVRTAIFAVAVPLSLAVIWQYHSPTGFREFMIFDVQTAVYMIEVGGSDPDHVEQIFKRWYSGTSVRSGGLLIGPFGQADMMLIPLAFAAAAVLQGWRQFRGYALLAICVAGVGLTFTRISLIALVVVLTMALATRVSNHRLGKPDLSRPLYGAALVIVVVLSVPLVAASRVTGAFGASRSSADHIRELEVGFGRLLTRPLGGGIGTRGNTATQYGVDANPVSDNALLALGNEVGVVLLGVFVVLLIRLLRGLRSAPDGPFTRGAYLALVGVLIAGLLHNALNPFYVTWILFGTVGLALNPAIRSLSAQELDLGRTSLGRSPTGPGKSMDVRYAAQILKRRWLLLALAAVVGAAAAFALTNRTPVYQAMSTLYVGSQTIDSEPSSGDITGNRAVGLERLTVTFAAMVDSTPTAQAALERTGVRLSPSAVVSRTIAGAQPGTNLLRVQVSDTDPTRASTLANGMADAFVAALAELEPGTSVDGESTLAYVFERATVPGRPAADSGLRNLVLGAFFGAALAAIAVLAIDRLDVTIRSVADAEQRVGIQVLGVIPRDASLADARLVRSADPMRQREASPS